MPEEFEVGIVGAGYVGLVTGACLARVGHRVTMVDKDADKVSGLERGRLPIYEPGLAEMIEGSAGRLSFGTDLAPVACEADVLFIAVGTPPAADGSADLSNVADVARRIGRTLAATERRRPLIVVNKSTVPVGAGDYVSMLILEGAEEAGGGKAEFRVVSNPEFLREGSAVHDTLEPDRVVLGSSCPQALETMKALYKPITGQTAPVVVTDLASAEMIKYAANAFLVTKISFINEISGLCELVGADVTSVSVGMGLDSRIGSRFLNAGIGWGGSCFPKDVLALKATAGEYEYESHLLDAAVSVNECQRGRVIGKLQRHLHTLKGKRIALLGLSFKPDTDDLREAPSLEIARMLNDRGARVVGYDPVSGKDALKLMNDLRVTFDPYTALEGAHAAVLVTEWQELRELDLPRAAALMQSPRLLVDGRNALEPGEAAAAGLTYEGFGRSARIAVDNLEEASAII